MGFDDGLDDDEPVFRPPLPPDDRLWRHPSEVGPTAGAQAAGSSSVGPTPAAPPHARQWTVALASGLVGALLATGITIAVGGDHHADQVQQVTEQVALPVGTTAEKGVAALAARLRPAIVQLQVNDEDVNATGSGVIFRDDGHVLTNAHIISSARKVTVVMSDGSKVRAKVVGSDPDTDVAVVKMDGGPYPVATLGTATLLRLGDQCIAIGSSLGVAGGPAVSAGVVSALGRSLDGDQGHRLYDMIQTDADIAARLSGGALLDSSGAVIGITTAIKTDDAGNDGLGFATPIDIARSVADELITTGTATHVWLGIEGADVDETTAEKLKVEGGAAVQKVVKDSPAGQAALAPGDVIVAVNGNKVLTMAALVVALRNHHTGQTVTIDYFRDGKPASAKVVLSERPAK